MKYLIEITQRQLEEIKRLVLQDKYRDLAQFMDTAIDNQLHIEKFDAAGEYHVPGSRILPDANQVQKSDGAEAQNVLAIGPDKQCLGLSGVRQAIKTVDAPKDDSLRFLFPEAGPGKNWFWGQLNRVFPVKVGIRHLAMALGDSMVMDFNAFRAKDLGCLSMLEGRIRAYERLNNVGRDKSISAGLPGAAAEDYKSHDRYKNQFLAVYRRDGKLDGALPLHKFANIIVENGKAKIGITQAGLEFALLENPVLDREDFSCSLSAAEKDFYINHMRNTMPGEYSGIRWMLSKISEGFSREDINAAMAEYFAHDWKNPSSEFITTQRAGMIARISELGLITKEKNGIQVKYLITDSGMKVLAE